MNVHYVISQCDKISKFLRCELVVTLVLVKVKVNVKLSLCFFN